MIYYSHGTELRRILNFGENKMTIGQNIKKLRRERDMTQEQLAEYMNVTVSAVSQWESGVSHS